LTEILKTNKYTDEGSLRNSYVLRQVFINPRHIVCLREDEHYKQLLVEGRLIEGLDESQSFTKIYLNRGQAGIDLTVIGTAASVQQKLGLTAEKQLLRG